jgi:hypothetical protein
LPLLPYTVIEKPKMNETLNTDEIRQALANLKEDLNEITQLIAAWCQVAVQHGDVGGAASVLCATNGDVKTLAEWAERFALRDDLGIEPETPVRLHVAWFRAVLDAPDPEAARELAMEKQWSAAQVKKYTGVRKYQTRDKLATMPGKWVYDGREGFVSFQISLGEELPDVTLPRDVILEIKER